MKNVNTFLYDLKDTDPVRHKEYTGVELGLVLENLQKLDDVGAKIYLPCLILPDLNGRPHGLSSARRAKNEMSRTRFKIEFKRICRPCTV